MQREPRFALLLMVLCSSLVIFSAQKAAAKFGNNGMVTTTIAADSNDRARSLILQPDGKLVAAGDHWTTNDYYFALVRYNCNGTLDTSFGSNGSATTLLARNGNYPGANYVILQPDGKLVTAGCDNFNFGLARYNRDGSLDTGFGISGKVNITISYGGIIHGLALQPDGKLVAAGQRSYVSYDFALARYNSDGSLDANFGSSGTVFNDIGNADSAQSIILQPDGKLIAAGYSQNYNDFALARYSTSGSPDASFGTGGVAQTSIGTGGCAAYSAILQTDGKVVAAGYSVSSNYDFSLARYNTNGSLDTTFNSTGKVITPIGSGNDGAGSLILQPDGKLVAVGYSVGSNYDFAVARYNSNGSLDTSFNGTGMVTTPIGSTSYDYASSVILQPDGKLVVAGVSYNGSNDCFALVRYSSNGSLDTQADLPLLLDIKPDHAVGGQTVTLDIHGWNLDDVINVQLRNTSGSVNGTILTKSGTRITAQFSMPAPGLYDLNLAKNLISQTFQSVFNAQTAMSQPVNWQMLDLGKAGNPIAGPCSLAIGDANQDSQNEIYVANSDNQMYICQKGSAWSVTPMPQEIGYFENVMLADINLDGKQEVYGVNSLPQVFQYQWTGSSWSKTNLGTSSGPLAKGHLAGGGLAELYSLSGNRLEQSRLFNQNWINNTVGQGAGSMLCSVAGDADNDQCNEVYAANADNYLYQYKYYWSGGYPSWYVSTTIYAGTQDTTCLAIGDLDQDGAAELYASNSDGNIYQFKRNGSSWQTQAINTTSLVANKIAISDADNDGADELYAAGQDGHAYEFKFSGTTWQVSDLGNTSVPLIALAVGDGDNSRQFKVYALGNNAHLYQFQAASIPHTPTPTATISPTSAPSSTATITPTLTPAATTIPDADKKLRVFHSQINPTRNEHARIRWYQSTNAAVNLVIYNLLGDKITTLAENRFFAPDQLQEVNWNGKNSDGTMVASGIYIVYLQSGDVKAWSKVAVIK